jgi:serine/threonine protein kinase
MKELLYSGLAFSHYQVISHLGTGGMGEVYKAVDTRLSRHVALKVLPAEWLEDKNRMRRFIQEAKSASALNHPHIVTIYEIGEALVEQRPEPSSGPKAPESPDSPPAKPLMATVHYIAMEYIDGDTLRIIIPRNALKMKKLLGWFADIADGLAAAHAAGIVHRDLKPDNIMIRQDGYAKIFDFGLAKLLEPEKPMIGDKTEIAGVPANLTQAGVVMGTVGYMSPEQVQGSPVDHRSDIFSFGCILFEAVTRKKAFEGISLIDTLHKIVYSPTPAISDVNVGASGELQRIIRKCLAKDPDERYQSIKEVATDLRELRKTYDETFSSVASQSVLAQPDQTPNAVKPGATPAPSQSPLYLALAVGGVLLLAVLATLYIMFGGSSNGKLTVATTPSGASVFIDNEFRGVTPLHLTLGEGLYRMRVDLDGYEPKMESFTITPKSDIQRDWVLVNQQVIQPSQSPDLSAGAAATPSSPAGTTEKSTPQAKKGEALAPETLNKKALKVPRGPYIVPVSHNHVLRRDCVGILKVDALNIQYITTPDQNHSFKIALKALKEVSLDKDRLIIQAAGIPSGKMEFQQRKAEATPQDKESNSSVAEVFNRIQEIRKLRGDLPARTAGPQK